MSVEGEWRGAEAGRGGEIIKKMKKVWRFEWKLLPLQSQNGGLVSSVGRAQHF